MSQDHRKSLCHHLYRKWQTLWFLDSQPLQLLQMQLIIDISAEKTVSASLVFLFFILPVQGKL